MGVRCVWVVMLWLVPSVGAAQVLVEPAEGLAVTERSVDVELRYGLALVTHRVRVAHEGSGAVDARLRFATPPQVGLASLRVCAVERGRPTDCREGRPADVDGVYETARTSRRRGSRPIAWAGRVRRYRRWSLDAAMAPLVGGRPLELTVRYVTPAPVVAGAVALTLPALDPDDDAPVTVRVRGPGLEALTVDERPGPWTVASDAPLRVGARMPTGAVHRSAWSVRCGARRCTRHHVAAGPVPPIPRDVFLLVDASPSVRVVDPARREHVVAAILAGLHPASRVRRVVFGREARLLDPEPRAPADVPADVPLPSLGNQTHLGPAWRAICDAVRAGDHPAIVILGDGLLTPGADDRAVFDELVASRAEVSVVALDPRGGSPSGRIADVVARSLGPSIDASRDDHALRRLAAPVVAVDVLVGDDRLGVLRAGEQLALSRMREGGAAPALRVLGRTIVPRPPRQLWADGFATMMAPDDRRASLVAVSRAHVDAAQKDERAIWGAGLPRRFARRARHVIVCHGCGGCLVRGAVSRESLGRVRDRLRPAVRACFARARRGRPSWSARAVLRLVISRGELLDADASSPDAALAACVGRVADDFDDFPNADGVVEARFPFLSEGELARPPVPLRPSVRAALDAIDVR